MKSNTSARPVGNNIPEPNEKLAAYYSACLARRPAMLIRDNGGIKERGKRALRWLGLNGLD